MPTRSQELLADVLALPAEQKSQVEPRLLDAASSALSTDAELRAELVERDRIELALLASQQELAELNHMLRLVMDTIPVRVYWKDRTLRFLGSNQHFADDAGVSSPNDLIGRTERDLSWHADADRNEAADRQVIESGEWRVDVEEPRTQSNGGQLWLRTTRAPLRTRSGTPIGVLVTYADITERRRLQQRLYEAGHMEALAQLAGGVAHDFNNLLTGIIGNAEFIRDDAPPDSEPATSATEILRSARRAAELTQQLLAFSRRGRLQSQPVDLHLLLSQTALLSAAGGEGKTRIETRLEARSAIVVGDPTQLGNALVALSRNAREAMPDGGDLLLATRDVTIDRRQACALGRDLVAGPFIEVTVADTGVGIAEAHLGRIFEPFFTTKAPGSGGGLGLAAVFGCVKSHGGHVTVTSEQGNGTTFKLLLPAAAGPVRRSTPVRVARATRLRGRIVVVDDEETVRSFATRALTKLGYEVAAFPDGLSALAHFAEHHASIDLVLLDLTMPHLSGEETFARMRAIDPAVRVVIASGHSHPSAADTLLAAGAQSFLAKPFRAHELASEVESHLRSEPLSTPPLQPG